MSCITSCPRLLALALALALVLALALLVLTLSLWCGVERVLNGVHAGVNMEGDPVMDQARGVVHQLYQLFKTHPHEAQWTKESKPLCGVSGRGGEVKWGVSGEGVKCGV